MATVCCLLFVGKLQNVDKEGSEYVERVGLIWTTTLCLCGRRFGLLPMMGLIL